MPYCIVFFGVIEKSCQKLEIIKALGLRPRAFICFSVFGTPDETLALVFDILPSALFDLSGDYLRAMRYVHAYLRSA